ncbi:MAG: hypothetical protein ACOCU4_01485, partial [Alkalispirochaeta sp.]
DVIARFGELGVRVERGIVEFCPNLISPREFETAGPPFRYLDLTGRWQSIDLPKGALAFTYCQVPVVYHLDHTQGMRVTLHDGSVVETATCRLSPELSRDVFNRGGSISRIDVMVTSPTGGSRSRAR